MESPGRTEVKKSSEGISRNGDAVPRSIVRLSDSETRSKTEILRVLKEREKHAMSHIIGDLGTMLSCCVGELREALLCWTTAYSCIEIE